MKSLTNKILAFWFSFDRKLRYLLVGGFNTVFAYSLFCLFQSLFGPSVHYLVVLVAVYFISVFNSFINLRFFVFRSRRNFWHEYLKVNFVYLWHLALNMLLLYVFRDKMHINIFAAQFICAMLLVVIVYFVHIHFSFKGHDKKN